MAYTPDNPYIPGDPYSYDLKWIVTQLKSINSQLTGLPTLVDIFSYLNDTDQLNIINTVTPQMFGALGDGTADDTDAIHRCFASGKNVFIPLGTYNYKTGYAETAAPSSDTIIVFEPGAVFKAINQNLAVSALLYFNGVSNIRVYNPTLVGDAVENIDTSEGAGHGITITGGCDNISIMNADISSMHTDGIYIRSGHINIDTFDISQVGRSGISITAGSDISVSNGRISEIRRAAPKAGLSLEPNYDYDIIDNVIYRDIIVDSVDGFGFYANLNKWTSAHDMHILYDHVKILNSASNVCNLAGTNLHTDCTGCITINDLYAAHNGGCLVDYRMSADNNLYTVISNALDFDNNRNSLSGTYGYIINNGGLTGHVGNLMINGLYSRDSACTRAISISDPDHITISNADLAMLAYPDKIQYKGDFPESEIIATASPMTNLYRKIHTGTLAALNLRTNIQAGTITEIISDGACTVTLLGATLDGSSAHTLTASAADAYIKLMWIDTDRAVTIGSNGGWAH